MPPLVTPVIVSGSLAQRPQPVIEAGGLVLRPWRDDDVAALVAAYEDPEIQRWHARSLTEEEAAAWIAERRARWREERGGDWAVCRGDGVVGRAGLHHVDLADGAGQLSYWVVPEARRRGVAGTALALLSDWALERAGFHRLELLHSTRNLPSCRVAQSCGYVLEGTKRAEALHPDGWHDMHLHARVRAADLSRSASGSDRAR